MGWLVATALRLRFIVVALAIFLVVTASNVLRNTAMDVFPEFSPPKVEIQTEVPGLSAIEVEALVTVPIESAMNGIAWLDIIRSKSVLGLSSVVMFFEDGTDLMQARQLVQERLALAAVNLPAVAQPPVILSPLSSTSRVLKIGMQSDKYTQMEMTTLAKWTIRPRLMALPGVANVAIWGERDRQLQVLVDVDRLQLNNISLGQVLQATRDAVTVSGGSFIEGPNQRFNVSYIQTILTPEDLQKVPVSFVNGAIITLGDIADIVEGSGPPIGDAIINDEPGLLLIVEKQPWGNTLDVTRLVEATLDDLKPGLQDINVDSTIFRPATYIENSLANLNTALLIGCLMVTLVLTAFLWNWYTTVISLIAIPISLLTAALILNYQGGVINTMVLAGLIIALGEVVDDAIIDVENITRRLRLNSRLADPLPAFQVVLDASLEVRSAVVFGSLIVVLVLFPVFMISGLTGTFFQPLAMSYICAILASLAVALILTPGLCLILLPNKVLKNPDDSALVKRLKRGYRPLLDRILNAHKPVVIIIAAFITVGAIIYPMMGQQLLPDFKEYDFLMHWLERPGTSLDAMNRVTIRASKELRSVEGVRNFGAHVGRTEVADEVVGVDFTELWISMSPEVDYEDTVAKVQEVVNGYPGLFRDLLTYLRERIKEVLTGASGSVVIRIFGPDLAALKSKAEEVAAAIRPIEGVIDLKVQQLNLIPQINIRFKEEAASIYGLKPSDLRKFTETIITGIKVGEIFEEQKIFDVVVRGVPRYSQNVDEIKRMLIDSPAGPVPLEAIAEVYFAPTPNQVTREAASRRIDVSLNIAGRALDAVAEDVNQVVADISFDQGYYPQILGEYAELQKARNELFIYILFVIIGIYLILQAHFDSNKIAMLIFLSLPVALVGGIFGALLSGGVLSLGSLIGFITVLGISARNGIMLMSHYRHLQREEGVLPGRELVIRGAEERLTPILMTALTTSLALMPLILGGIKPGHEIEHPMAVVILGGLITSALLNLFLVPTLFLKFCGGGFIDKKLEGSA